MGYVHTDTIIIFANPKMLSHIIKTILLYMNYILIIVIFLLCILLLASSGIAIKFFNEYDNFLESHKTTDDTLYNAWKNSNKMSYVYLWGAIGTSAFILVGIIIFFIYKLRTSIS